jgi:hypothetical protein
MLTPSLLDTLEAITLEEQPDLASLLILAFTGDL